MHNGQVNDLGYGKRVEDRFILFNNKNKIMKIDNPQPSSKF